MARPTLSIISRKEPEHDIAHYLELVQKRENVIYDNYKDTSLDSLKRLIDAAIAADYCIYHYSGVDPQTAQYIEKNKRPNLMVCASFDAGFSVPVDEIEHELQIKWDDVSDYHMKWLTLYITMNDGTELEYDCEDCLTWDSVDTKRPSTLEIEEY